MYKKLLKLTSILLDVTHRSKVSFISQISSCILEFCLMTSSLSRQAALYLACEIYDNYSSIFVQLHQCHRLIIPLGQNQGEICGINYSEVCDVSRQVGNGLLLLAQLTAEFSGLVYQIYNNVLSRQTAMILQLKLLDLLWQSSKYWLRLTLSSSVFCSKPFIVSLLDFRFCSRWTISDSFKAKIRQAI